MKQRTENEIKASYRQRKKKGFFTREMKIIEKYSTETYKMSDYEATVFSIITYYSKLKDHCFTASTRVIEEETWKCRSTIMRALKRLEENLIIIKFETTTKVPYYVPRDLYYARVYQRIDIDKYYPDNIVNVKPELTKIKELYNNDTERIKSQVITFIKESKALEVNIDKELKTAPFMRGKDKQSTYF